MIAIPPSSTKEDYEILHQLGEGGSAEVFLVRHTPTGKRYAMKSINKRKIADSESKAAVRENVVLQLLEHPFIVTLHASFEDGAHVYFILSYIEGGDLHTFIRQQQKRRQESKSIPYVIDLISVKRIFAEILLAIEYVHNQGLIIRDLKPENILLNREGHALLADFGLAVSSGTVHRPSLTSKQTVCGTPEYMAPEVIREEEHTTKVDIWSLGILVYELLTGRTPFYSEDSTDLFFSILTQRLTFNGLARRYSGPASEEHIEQLNELLRKMLTKDPVLRPTCRQIKKDPYFKDVCWQDIFKQEASRTTFQRTVQRTCLDSSNRVRSTKQLMAPLIVPYNRGNACGPAPHRHLSRANTHEPFHVLILDDDRTTLAVMEEILSKFGFVVDVYKCPLKALEAIEHGQTKYDLYMIDLIMPKMNGDKVIDRIHELSASSSSLKIESLTDTEEEEKKDIDSGDMVQSFHTAAGRDSTHTAPIILMSYQLSEHTDITQSYVQNGKIATVLKKPIRANNLHKTLLLGTIYQHQQVNENVYQ